MKPHEVHFKLHAAELPVKNAELTQERIVAEADLARLLGTLRYLRGLRAARERAVRAVQPDGAKGAPDAGGEGCLTGRWCKSDVGRVWSGVSVTRICVIAG